MTDYEKGEMADVTVKRVRGWQFAIDRLQQAVGIRTLFEDGTDQYTVIERERIRHFIDRLESALREFEAQDSQTKQ
jgi:hypothetical protein